MSPASSVTRIAVVAGRRASARILPALASLELTLAVLAAFAAALTAVYFLDIEATWPIALPMMAFAINLAAAVAVNGVLRRQFALLTFHLSLIAVVLLIAAGRLTHLRGEAEVSVGAEFDGRLAAERSGLLHPGRIADVRFINEGYTIDYSPGMRRNETRNAVAWVEGGRLRRAVIGDQQPVVLNGYRFYTSHNKGFAPTFVWRNAAGAYRGTVHLPAYPGNEHSQAQEWTPPGSDVAVWVMLDMERPVYDEQGAWTFSTPAAHKLVVRAGDDRLEMLPGDDYALPGGVLRYEGLTTWMGYSVFYDFTLPWLLAASLLAVASLAWHFWRKLAARPWDA